MARAKLTITLDDQAVCAIRAVVAARKATSISSFVRHAVAVALDDVAGWGAMLRESLQQTGGGLTQAEREWADGILGDPPRPRNQRARRPDSQARAKR